MAIGSLVISQTAHAQLVSINETFTGTTLSSGWQVGGSGSTSYTPNLTAASGIDSAGSGWMRLTSAVGNESTFAYDSNAFSSANATVALKFNYASYGTTSNGVGADGITFFLADASKTFAVGSYGGSLGYAQRTAAGGGGADTNGMSGGYIGLGLDEYGNYAAATEGRVGGISGITGNGGQMEVAVRGPGQSLTGYDYLGGTGILPAANPIAFAASNTRPTGVNQRTFEVIITASNQLTVYMQAGAGAALSPLYSIDLSGYTRPDNLVLGFTGSTGGDNDIHEVQGLQLTSQAARLWTNIGATSTWSSASNWDGGSAIPAVGADILLDNHYVSSAQTISVGAGTTRSIRSLQIDAPFSYTLDSSTINNGTLQFADQGVLGPSGIFVSQGHGTAVQTINSNLIANNAIEIKNQSTSALNLNGTLANGGNVVTLSGTGTTNLTGVISGTGSITKNDGGTAAISGNNTYSGGTALTAGTVSVGHNNALGTGTVTITGGTLASTASNTISNAISLQGNASLSNITTAGTLTQSGGNYGVTMLNATQTGGVNLSEGNTGRTLTVGVDTGNSTISGVIQDGGTGAGGLTKIGVGTLTLSGANTYTGTSTINGGTLQLGGNDRLAATSGLNISAMGNFNLANFSQKVGTLTAAGGASIDFGSTSGANTFVFGTYVAPASGVLVINNWESALDKLATTVAGQNVSTIYISGAGVAQEAGSTSALGGTYGNGYLLTPVAAVYRQWTGASNSTWSTTSNWFGNVAPGTTDIALFDSLGLGQLAPNLTGSRTIAGIRFGSGATGSYNITGGGRTLTLAGTVPYIQQQSASSQTIAVSTLALGNSTVADITGAGNLTISSVISGAGFSLIKDGTGAGKLILSGANTFDSGLYINTGTVQANNNAALGTGNATISSGATLEISGGRTLSNAISVGGAGVGGAGAIHNVNGTNTLSGAITETGATTFAADTGTTLNLTGGLTGTNVDTTFTGAGSHSVSTIATGTGGVTVNGTGTVTFNGGTNANTYTGTTTVNSGKLLLNKSAGTTAVGGNLVIGSGTGGAKSAVVQLGAANQITSSVTMGSDGLFDLNGQNETITSLSGSGNIDNTNAGTATLSVGDTTSTAYSGVIQDLGGSLSLIKQGSGKLTLSGANAYSGTTTLNDGILTIQHNTALGTGVLTVASGGNLQVAGNLSNVANAMTLNGPGTLANGGAVESYSGSNTLSGLLTLGSASRIQADSGSALTITGNITGAGQGLSLGGAGNITVNGSITTASGGTLTKDGPGYVILKSGASTFTGATAVNAGTLEIQNSNALGATSGATVASGATLALSGNISNTAPLNLSGQGVGNYGALRNLSGANTMSGAIALNAATTVGVDAGTLTASGAISGATGSDLTKVGTGTLTISGGGANTMAGNFNVNDGTVILNKNAGVNATGNGTGALTIGDNVGAANSATVQLAANNQINTATAVVLNSDGKLDVNGQTQQIGSLAGSGSVALGAGAAVLTVGNASNTTFSGAVSTTGTGAITKTGLGTLLLQQTAGSNAFAASKLNLNQGTVQLGASNILNSALNFNGGTLSVNGFSDTVSSATLTSSSVLDFNSLAGVFDFTNGLYAGGTLTINNWAGSTLGGGSSQLRLPGTVTGALLANINFAGYGAGAQIVNGEIVPITGTSYSWKVDSDGAWNNTGNWNPSTGFPDAPNASAIFGNVITSTHVVSIDAANRTVGYLTFNSSNNYTIAPLAISPGNHLTFAVTSGNAQLNVSGAGSDTISAGVILNSALVINQNSTGTLTLSNTIGGAQNITVGGAGNTVISGAIGTASGSLTKNNGGTLTLGGVNTYSGGTTINGGNVAISADSNLGAATGALTLNGGTLENTANLTLAAGRVVSVGAGGGTFQTDTGTNLIYNGVVTGAGTLNKTGAGTFTTGGASANTQSGAVNVNAGVYEIAKTANVSGIGVNSAVTVASGATLKLNGTGLYVAETIGSLAGAGTVTNASANVLALTVGGNGTSTTFSGALQPIATGGALSLVKMGTGTLTLTDTAGASNYTGTTTVSQGVLNIQASTALGSTAGGTSVASGAALEVQGGIAVAAEALTLNGAGLTGNANGALRNVSGNNSMAGAITLGSAATIQSDAGTLTLSGAVGGAGQNLTLDGAGNITMSGSIGTTSGTLTKNGSGYATLSGNSTFTGATSINVGTLEIQNGNALGTAAGGVTVASGATLAMSGNITSAETPITLNGVGDGSAGALRSLSGTNTLSGTSVVLASSSLVGVDTGTLTVSGVVSGAGNLTKVGAGTLVLSGANSYTGSTFINAGTVQIDSDARLSAAQLTFNGGTLATTSTMTLQTARGISLSTGGGTISTAAATTATYGGVIDGSGGLTKAGAGTLVLTGTNTFSGATNVNGGTLSISSDAQLGTAPVSATAGQLSFNGGTLATTASMTLNANRGIVVNAGGGTISVANANTLTFGGTIAGTGNLSLALNGSGLVNLTSNVNFSSGTLSLSGGTLLLSGINLSVGTFHITGNTILDFGNNVASTLTTTNFIVDAGVTVTVNNWTNGSDYFFANSSFTQNGGPSAVFGARGSAPENQVTFSGFSNNSTGWISYDHQITPVPEPSVYGAVFLGGCLTLLGWRRWRKSVNAR